MNESKQHLQYQLGPEIGRLVLNRVQDRVVFGRILHQGREQAELTVVELAGEAGVSAAYLRMIERGERAPSRDVLFSLLDSLGAEVVSGPKTLLVAGIGETFSVEPSRRIGKDAQVVRLVEVMDRLEAVLLRLEALEQNK